MHGAGGAHCLALPPCAAAAALPVDRLGGLPPDVCRQASKQAAVRIYRISAGGQLREDGHALLTGRQIGCEAAQTWSAQQD